MLSVASCYRNQVKLRTGATQVPVISEHCFFFLFKPKKINTDGKSSYYLTDDLNCCSVWNI